MKKLLASVLAAACLLSAAVLPVSAITKADQPITGGNTKFGQAEMMYTGEPTATSAWSNAFCNEDWTGCRWTAATEDGIACIKVVPVTGKTNHYMDFNWYQWNNDKYYPSLDCSQYKFIKAKYKFNDAAAKVVGKSQFWASQDSPKLSATLGTGTVSFDLPHTANKWETVTVDLSGLELKKDSTTAKWTETTIRQFRYYPFGTAAIPDDAVCFIEYIAFFKTKAEADAYQGPAAEAAAAAEAAKKAATPAAAKTADPIALVVLAASASMGLAFVASKKH